jgi:hypothetical protein
MLEKVCDRNVQRDGDQMQSAGTNAVFAVLVFLNLLESHPERFAKLLLARIVMVFSLRNTDFDQSGFEICLRRGVGARQLFAATRLAATGPGPQRYPARDVGIKTAALIQPRDSSSAKAIFVGAETELAVFLRNENAEIASAAISLISSRGIRPFSGSSLFAKGNTRSIVNRRLD